MFFPLVLLASSFVGFVLVWNLGMGGMGSSVLVAIELPVFDEFDLVFGWFEDFESCPKEAVTTILSFWRWNSEICFEREQEDKCWLRFDINSGFYYFCTLSSVQLKESSSHSISLAADGLLGVSLTNSLWGDWWDWNISGDCWFGESSEIVSVSRMSGAPRLRSMNVAADSEARPVLGPNGNKTGSLSSRKPTSKPLRKAEKLRDEVASAAKEKKGHHQLSPNVTTSSPQSHSVASLPSVLRRHEQLLQANLSLNASCSSDASTDSFHSRASTGRLTRSNSLSSRRKPYVSKPRSVASDGALESPPDGSQSKKRCTWVTPNTGSLSSLTFTSFLSRYFLMTSVQTWV